MRLKEEIRPADWDLAYCYEAMARVMALKQDQAEFERWYALDLEAGRQIASEGARRQFESDLNDGNWFGLNYRPK